MCGCLGQDEKGEWLIYVTDEGQAGHFKLVFGAGKRSGIIPAENPPRIDHVGFGLVLGQDGKRIRTRDSGAVRTPLLCLPSGPLHHAIWKLTLAAQNAVEWPDKG